MELDESEARQLKKAKAWAAEQVPADCHFAQLLLREVARLEADSAKLRQRVEELEHTIGIYEATGPIQFLKAQNKKLLERVAELVEALNVTVGEFFEDGLSADLAEGEITTLPEAYVEGYRDAENEVKGRLRAVLAKHDKEKP